VLLQEVSTTFAFCHRISLLTLKRCCTLSYGRNMDDISVTTDSHLTFHTHNTVVCTCIKTKLFHGCFIVRGFNTYRPFCLQFLCKAFVRIPFTYKVILLDVYQLICCNRYQQIIGRFANYRNCPIS